MSTYRVLIRQTEFRNVFVEAESLEAAEELVLSPEFDMYEWANEFLGTDDDIEIITVEGE